MQDNCPEHQFEMQNGSTLFSLASLWFPLAKFYPLPAAKSLCCWHQGLIYSIHRAGDTVIDEEIKSFTKLEQAFYFEWRLSSSSFPDAGMSILERDSDDGKKSLQKNRLASQMISHYLANVLLSLYQFFSLFHVTPQLQGNWEHTVRIFEKRLWH